MTVLSYILLTYRTVHNSVLVPLKVCITHFPVIILQIGAKQVILCTHALLNIRTFLLNLLNPAAMETT